MVESIRGSKSGMFNPISVIYDIISRSYSEEDDDEEELNVFLQILQGLAGNLLNSTPYGEGVISNFFPNEGIFNKYLKPNDVFGDEYSPTRYGANNLIKGGIKDPVTLLPFGTQFNKTYKGIKAIQQGGVYTKDGNLKYPVEVNTANKIKGALFGTSGFKETDNFYSNNIKTLSEQETEIYQSLVNNGMSPEDAYNQVYLRKKEKIKKTNQSKIYNETAKDIINSVDLELPKNVKVSYEMVEAMLFDDMPDAEKDGRSFSVKEYSVITKKYLDSAVAYRNNFLKSDDYARLTDKQRKNVWSKINSYSKGIGYKAVTGVMDDDYKGVETAKKYGVNAVTYYSIKEMVKGIEGDKVRTRTGKLVSRKYSTAHNQFDEIVKKYKMSVKDYRRTFKAMGYTDNEINTYRFPLPKKKQ